MGMYVCLICVFIDTCTVYVHTYVHTHLKEVFLVLTETKCHAELTNSDMFFLFKENVFLFKENVFLV